MLSKIAGMEEYNEERLLEFEQRVFTDYRGELYRLKQTKDAFIWFYTAIEFDTDPNSEWNFYEDAFQFIREEAPFGLDKNTAFQEFCFMIMELHRDKPEVLAEVARRRDLICRGEHYLDPDYRAGQDAFFEDDED